MKDNSFDRILDMLEAYESPDYEYSCEKVQDLAGFIYTAAMNKTLYDNREYVGKGILRQLGVSFNFDIGHFYCCLTGLKKKIYTSVYGLSFQEYLAVYRAIKEKLKSQLFRYDYAANIFITDFDEARQIVVLYSPMRENCIPPKEMALQISETIQEGYEKAIFKGENRYCNFTALSSRLSGFSDIREGFLQTSELSDYSFFRMEPIVVTLEDIKEWRNKADYNLLIMACTELKQAMLEGDKPKSEDCQKAIFSLLKDSFDLSLCSDALSYIKSVLEVFYTVYEIKDCIDLDKLCDMNSYNQIEEICDALSAVVKYLCEQVNMRGKRSGVVQQAIYYIKNHYQNDVSLTNIAQYAGITPSYLSGLFKREVGMTVSKFIMFTRIEKAKTLLESSGQKVHEIAKAVGFYDIKYFRRMFKKLVSLNPLEYRDKSGLFNLEYGGKLCKGE